MLAVSAALPWEPSGGLAPVVPRGGSLRFNWLIYDPSTLDRRLDMAWLNRGLPAEIAGCATFCAAAGWVAFAPVHRFGFARSACSVFLLSLAIWLLLISMGFNPKHFKGDPLPTLRPDELVFVVAPPLAAASLPMLAPMMWRVTDEESPSPKTMTRRRRPIRFRRAGIYRPN